MILHIATLYCSHKAARTVVPSLRVCQLLKLSSSAVVKGFREHVRQRHMHIFALVYSIRAKVSSLHPWCVTSSLAGR